MKQLIYLLAFAALYSCTDEFETPEQTAVQESKKSTSRVALNALTLNVATSGLVQGPVSNTVALQNRNTMNTIIANAVTAGYDGLIIDQLDCYFMVGATIPPGQVYDVNLWSINIPSHFSLIMSENTHLRVQPNNHKNYSLLSVKDKEDIGIEGGNLHGERRQHTWSGSTYVDEDDGEVHDSTDEWGHLLTIVSGVNVDVQGTRFYEANGDGISISSSQFYTAENYNPSREILIQNCFLDSNRRSNISITNGNTITINQCTFKDAGINLPGSAGTNPRMSVNIEATRKRVDGVLVLLERAYNIDITNNTETCANYGGFHVSIGDNVRINNNTTQSSIGFYLASQVNISDNTLERPTVSSGTTVGIAVSGIGDSDTVFGNVVENNSITRYTIGINMYQHGTTVSRNTINECLMGIQVTDIRDCYIDNNKIYNTNRSGAKGIGSGLSSLDNVVFAENAVMGNFVEAVYFYQFNQDPGTENNSIIFQSNLFDCRGKVHFTYGRGLSFESNRLYTNLYVNNLQDCALKYNGIRMFPTESFAAIQLWTSSNVQLSDNYVEQTQSASQVCLNVADCDHLDVNNNYIKQSGIQNTLSLNNVDDSEVRFNQGDIGTTQYFMRGYYCDNTAFEQNRAITAPFSRSQFPNCTGCTVIP